MRDRSQAVVHNERQHDPSTRPKQLRNREVRGKEGYGSTWADSANDLLSPTLSSKGGGGAALVPRLPRATIFRPSGALGHRLAPLAHRPWIITERYRILRQKHGMDFEEAGAISLAPHRCRSLSQVKAFRPWRGS